MILQNIYTPQQQGERLTAEQMNAADLRDTSALITPEPGLFSGVSQVWKGLPSGAYKSGSAFLGAASSTVASPESIRSAAEEANEQLAEYGFHIDNPEDFSRRQSQSFDDRARELRKTAQAEYGVDPSTMGTIASTLHGLFEILPKGAVYSLAGPGVGSVLFGADLGIGRAQELKDKGVDEETAATAGLWSFGAGALGLRVPAAFGPNRWISAAGGAGANMLFTAAEMGAISHILKNQKYDDLAKQYELTVESMGVSGLFGAAAGAFFFRSPSLAARALDLQTQRTRVADAIYSQLRETDAYRNKADLAWKEAEQKAASVMELSRRTGANPEEILPAIRFDENGEMIVPEGALAMGKKRPIEVYETRIRMEEKWARDGYESLVDTAKKVIVSYMRKAEKFYANRKTGQTDNPKKEAILPITAIEREEARRAGLSIDTLMLHAVSADAFRHTDSRHGAENPKGGQISVTDADLVRVAEIISAPDRVIYGAKTKLKDDAIIYQKTDGGYTLIVIEEIHPRAGMGVVKTVWKKKGPALDAKSFTTASSKLTSGTLGVFLTPSSTTASLIVVDSPVPRGGGIEHNRVKRGSHWSEDTFFQESQSEGGPAGFFDPTTNSIVMTKNANLSTFSHEWGHWYLQKLFDFAREGKLTGEMRADLQALLDSFGLKSLDEWSSLDAKARERFHEQFARQFEQYLQTGKAPDSRLQYIFGSIARAIKEAYEVARSSIADEYKAQTGYDLPPMSEEVKAVFDRMFKESETKITEDQVAAARSAQAAVASQRKIDALDGPSGHSPQAFDARERAARKAEQAMIDGERVDVTSEAGRLEASPERIDDMSSEWVRNAARAESEALVADGTIPAETAEAINRVVDGEGAVARNGEASATPAEAQGSAGARALQEQYRRAAEAAQEAQRRVDQLAGEVRALEEKTAESQEVPATRAEAEDLAARRAQGEAFLDEAKTDAMRVERVQQEMPEQIFTFEDADGNIIRGTAEELLRRADEEIAQADAEAASYGTASSCVLFNRGIE